MLRLSSVYLAVSQCDKKWRASLIDTPVFAFAGGRKARQSKAKWGQKFYQSNIFCSFESWDVSWVNWKFIGIPLWVLGEIKWNQLSQELSYINLKISLGICCFHSKIVGMETFRGQWHFVDTIFQSGRLFVDVPKGWLFVDTFGDISWTILVRLSKHCSVPG